MYAHEGETVTDECAHVFDLVFEVKMFLHPVSTGSGIYGSCFHWVTSAAR